MLRYIKGGLIYEFTEEPNNYGLVKILPDLNVQLLEDFHMARVQFRSLPKKIRYYGMEEDDELVAPTCKDSYKNLFVAKNLPPCVGQDLINKGVRVQPGGYVELTEKMLQSPYKVIDVDGKLVYMAQARVEVSQPISLRPSSSLSGTYARDVGRKKFTIKQYELSKTVDNHLYVFNSKLTDAWALSDDEVDDEPADVSKEYQGKSLLNWTYEKGQALCKTIKTYLAHDFRNNNLD